MENKQRLYVSRANIVFEKKKDALSADDISEISTVKNERLRNQKAAARLLLRLALKEYGLQEKESIKKTDKGKPYIKKSNLFFSISHAEGLVACVIANMEIGVDVEKVKKSPSAAIKGILCPGEMSVFQSLSQKEKNEYACVSWTLKESLVKLLGCGIEKRPCKIDIEGYSLADEGKIINKNIDGKEVFFCFRKIEDYYVSTAMFAKEDIEIVSVDLN